MMRWVANARLLDPALGYAAALPVRMVIDYQVPYSLMQASLGEIVGCGRSESCPVTSMRQLRPDRARIL